MKADKTRKYLYGVILWDWEQEEFDVDEELTELERLAAIGKALEDKSDTDEIRTNKYIKKVQE